jgi:Sulfotransferase family
MQPGPYPLQENDQIFFMHIPKTGGMTLKTLLKQRVGSNTFHQIPIEKFSQTHARDLVGYRCIRAHWDYSFFRVLSRKPVYITMLRHPVARMLSMYGMVRRKPDSRWYTADIHEFIDRISAERLQAHFLAGVFSSQQLSQTALLELSLTRLDECAFYGITEQFSASLDLLCAIFGWQPAAPEKRNAAAPGVKPVPDAEVVAHIETASRVDMDLYNEAVKGFGARKMQAAV